MIWYRLFAARSKTAPKARVLSTSSTAALGKEDSFPYWMIAAAVAAASGSIAFASSTDCEEQKPRNEFQRFYSQKHGLRDPMTSYAKYAMEQEIKRENLLRQLAEQEQQKNDSNKVIKSVSVSDLATESTSSDGPAVQATSSVAQNSEKHRVKDPIARVAKKAMEQEKRGEQVADLVQQKPDFKVLASDRTPCESTLPYYDGPVVQATSVEETPNSTPVDMSARSHGEEIMTQSEARIEEATRKAKQHSGGLKIFSGNGNMSLALEIARHLGVNLGKATVGKFADGEVNVVIHENVRGKDVYVVQPTCPPVNDNIMELLLMVSTLRRSSARRITVVIPYYGYARQDRKMQV
jgi:hypothetical protein